MIKEKIDSFVTIDDLQVGKPDPEGYLLCLKRLRVEQAVVVEDSPVGAQAAPHMTVDVQALDADFSPLAGINVRADRNRCIIWQTSIVRTNGASRIRR